MSKAIKYLKRYMYFGDHRGPLYSVQAIFRLAGIAPII